MYKSNGLHHFADMCFIAVHFPNTVFAVLYVLLTLVII